MDPALMEGRFRARRFMHKYNTHFPDDATADSLTQEREVMLRSQFGKIGKDCFIEPPLNIDYGSNIIIGDRFYSNFKSVHPPYASITISR
jgi:acetyltransferase-like isoleucine patch superfamily enzyme